MSTHLSSLDPSLPSSLPNSSQPLDHSLNILSKLGQTRCYWGLLDSDLNFLYFDPLLQGLLGPQADLLVGKSLLQFVHPDEQATAKHDLSGVLGNRTLHGSVTRVRFSRLSRVRRELGYQGHLSPWPEAEKTGADSNYMAVDIVINWAAESLVLCFIHAVADSSSDDDSNEESKNTWTNWCGTPQMTHDQVQLMYQRLLDRIPRPRDMTRVFQILLNRPDRQLYMSWPQQGTDGQPNSRDFAKLADEVQIGSPAGSDSKTSCTRRYKALQQIYMGSAGNKEVESIFIPHGSIIFACHKVELSRYPHAAPANGNPVGYASSSYGSQPQTFYEHASSSYNISRLPSGSAYDYLHQPPSSQNMVSHFHPPEQWPQSSSSAPGHYNQDWASAAVSPTSNVRGAHVPSQNNQHQWPSHPPSYVDQFSTQSGGQRSMSPYHYSQATGDNTGSDGGSGPNEVPPPRSGQRRGTARDQYGNGGRSTGKPPVGVNKCSSCKVTQSPEWRKGPSGKKDLCNACGLRYARSRAKKEGVTSSRRRKDKPFSPKSASAAQQQATQGSASASVARRATFDESSFLSSPATPDGDGYSPQTIKTTPPSSRSATGFVHYGQSHSSIDTRAPQYNYSVPSSMSESTTMPHPSPHTNGVSLPRLTTASFSTTSSANSPMSSTHASSFERDSVGLSTRPRDRLKREREQVGSPIHLPPTPMSASSDWSRKSTSFI